MHFSFLLYPFLSSSFFLSTLVPLLYSFLPSLLLHFLLPPTIPFYSCLFPLYLPIFFTLPCSRAFPLYSCLSSLLFPALFTLPFLSSTFRSFVLLPFPFIFAYLLYSSMFTCLSSSFLPDLFTLSYPLSSALSVLKLPQRAGTSTGTLSQTSK